MSFTIKQKFDMTKNLRRLLLKQTRRAIRQLQRFEASPQKTVHEARISFKRARTLLRLLRYEFGHRSFNEFNTAYRDLGFELSAQRDGYVKQKLMLKLFGPNQSLPAEFNDRNRLTIADEHKLTVDNVLIELNALHSRIAKQTSKEKGFSVLHRTSIEICKHQLLAHLAAERSGKDIDFHEWRKCAKHLYHLISILRPANPQILVPMKKNMYRLTQLLGDVQDISIIKQECCSDTGGLKGRRDLLDYLQTEQQALQQNAITLAESIEIKDPEVFVGQLESYWVEFRKNHSSFGLPARSTVD